MFFPSYTYSFYLGFTTALPKHFKYIISTAFFGAHLTLFVHAHLGHGSLLETEFASVSEEKSTTVPSFPPEHHQRTAENFLHLSPRNTRTCFGTHGKYKAMLEIKLQQI